MSERFNPFDQRKSFRCPVPDCVQVCELRVKRRRFAARVFNESSGGFGVIVEENPKLEAGDIAQLLTGQGEFEVRVAYIGRVESTEPNAAERPAFRIGLVRFRDVTPQDAAGARLHRLPCRPRLLSGTTVVVAATLLVLSGAMGAATVLLNLNNPLVKKVAGWEQAPRVESSPEQTLAHAVKELGLTRSQQVQLQEAARRTGAALREIDARLQELPPEERARKQAEILAAARREALSMLSEEQRQRWKAAMGEEP